MVDADVTSLLPPRHHHSEQYQFEMPQGAPAYFSAIYCVVGSAVLHGCLDGYRYSLKELPWVFFSSSFVTVITLSTVYFCRTQSILSVSVCKVHGYPCPKHPMDKPELTELPILM
ncbi:hypothetical protein TNCV_4408141 [Trichonephila clavipes]|nr:hypothetical protein TNCV_4408141 [Trichonephila clavipes]